MESGEDVGRREVHSRLRLLAPARPVTAWLGFGLAALLVVLLGSSVAHAGAPFRPVPVSVDLARMSAEDKAALVVVSGLPAPSGVGGAIVFASTRHLEVPNRAPLFVDQEGGVVKRYRGLPPFAPASSYRRSKAAFRAGQATGRALARVGVDVDLAPVLDSRDGPLGSRHFRRPGLGISFAKGLLAGGTAPCAKHFPGLGSTPESTDVARVFGVVRGSEVWAFRAAALAGVPCVMVSHAIYPSLGKRRASLEPRAYELLRRQGFTGVAITDSLSALGPNPRRWARMAARAGADLILVQKAGDVQTVIDALTPLARNGRLDEAVVRVISFRRSLGFTRLP